MSEHDNYAKEFIEAAGIVRKECPGSHISGGLSNLSFGFRGLNKLRDAMHSVFLYHAI
jgi:5-methyltetrahydrofolate--homocysteine methyltransferase